MSRRGHTQASLGGVLDVSHRAVGKWLAGESRPGPAVALKLAEHFGVSIDGLLDDESDLPPDEMEQRYAEAKAVAEHYPVDNPKARQLAFEKQLERSAHAQTLRETAKRLRDEAERLDQIADVFHLAEERKRRETLTPSVAENVDVARRLRLQAEAKRQAGDVSYRTPPARAAGT
jgi:transcriptional regulator with XRE-family HTH domain